ncbi:MAG: HU family DNA-binding protein [Acidimicrobiia bacterium]|nr:HU family DNA-binding protein [Acidimicrobiia bacterium]
MAKKAAPKAAQGKAATPPAAKAATGKAATAPAAKAATRKAATAPAAKAPTKPADTAGTTRPKPANRAVVYTALAETTGLGKNQVTVVFAALGELIAKELGKKGPGQVVLPGLLKLKVVRKPATKARSGKNPFTGEPMTIQAKPARNVVRALPLKALKEMV